MRDWVIVTIVILLVVYLVFITGVLSGRADMRCELEQRGYVFLTKKDRKALSRTGYHEERGMIMKLTIEQRVQGGMAWLDEHYPNHVETFNPDEFHIMLEPAPNGHSGRCVLMQATGARGWVEARSTGDIDELAMMIMDLGFAAAYRESNELNRAWIKAYAERKAALTN